MKRVEVRLPLAPHHCRCVAGGLFYVGTRTACLPTAHNAARQLLRVSTDPSLTGYAMEVEGVAGWGYLEEGALLIV